MNKLLSKFLIPLISAISMLILMSDIIPENSVSVYRTVQITNCASFNEIVFIGYIEGPMVDEHPFYEIKQDSLLQKGYKHNDLYVLGINKSDLDAIGGVNSLTKEHLENLNPQRILSSGSYYIPDNSSLNQDDLYYNIEGSTPDSLYAVLKKRVLTFENNYQNVIEY